MKSDTKVLADHPISTPDEDLLQRAPIAEVFADQLLQLDASKGLVVGVLGEWGSGKTSFVNMASAFLRRKEVPVVQFNPWMFSGAQQLVDSFFIEIGAELKLRRGLDDVAEHIQDYGESLAGLSWVPVVGPWLARTWGVAKVFARLTERRRQGVGGKRIKISKALETLDVPIVVVLDDVDRLTSQEIRDMFKLVRLTASFPNLVYILAFDRFRVEQALAEHGIPGRDYLEKILQVAIDIPALPPEVLQSQILQSIDLALSGGSVELRFNADLWPDIFAEIVRPLIKNMRDVRRYAAAITGTARHVGSDIELSDILGLEAVRVFMPEVFSLIPGARAALTTPYDRSAGVHRGDGPLKASIESLLQAGGDREAVVRSAVERLFPAALRHMGGSSYGGDWLGRWLRDGRVAHEDVLRLYLERVASPGLERFRLVEGAWQVLDQADAFGKYLRRIDPEQLRDVIAGLETYEDEYRTEHVVPGVAVLLNVLPMLPDEKRGMFDFGPQMVVGRVTYRLLRSLKDKALVLQKVEEILPKLDALWLKLDLLTTVGHRENAGHGLISVDAAATLERRWRDEVRAATPEQLALEGRLAQVLHTCKRDRAEDEPELSVPDTPEITLAILQDSYGEVLSQAMGSRAVKRKPRLAWEVLVELVGDEEALAQRVAHLKSADQTADGDLLSLVDRYLSGWRPSDFGGR